MAARITLIVVFLLVAASVPHFAGEFWTRLLMQIMIFGLLALSTDLLLGHAGLFSLCHASFFAVAAYATAILQVRYGVGTALAACAGIVAGTLLALVFAVAVRTRGVYFILITLAFGYIIWGVAYRWASFTGGDNGVTYVPLPAIGSWRVTDATTYYYVVLAVVLICLLAYRILTASPFGLTLRGIRENEGRMKSLGFNTWLHCYLSYVIAGAFASVAGVVWAYYNGFVSPTYLDLTASSELFLMVTLGGPSTLIGPVLGAGIIVLLKNVMSAYTARWLLILGIVYIVGIMAAPKGVWNLGSRQ
jgi:branched-chain amino acid transport system permease protein